MFGEYNALQRSQSKFVVYMEANIIEGVKAKTKYRFPYVIEPDEGGFFIICPVLKGCATQGDTREEAIENIKDAIWLCLKCMEDDDEVIVEPQISDLPTVEVEL